MNSIHSYYQSITPCHYSLPQTSRNAKVRDLLARERDALRPLPKYTFETASCTDARVNAFSTVRFRTNTYSVPVRYAGLPVSIKGYPETVEIYHKGDLISVHDRLMGRNQTSYHLEDYMPLLEKRPRAVFDAAPVKQNIPAEVLEQLRAKKPSREHVLGLLHFYADRERLRHVSTIKDVVTVMPVDLHKYDSLCIGKEAAVK